MTYNTLKLFLKYVDNYLARVDEKKVSPQYLSAVKELKNSIEKVLKFL